MTPGVRKGSSVRLNMVMPLPEQSDVLVVGASLVRWRGQPFPIVAYVPNANFGHYLIHPDDALHLRAVMALDPSADMSDYVRNLLTNAKETDNVQTP